MISQIIKTYPAIPNGDKYSNKFSYPNDLKSDKKNEMTVQCWLFSGSSDLSALYALLFEISKKKGILENSKLFSHESITNSVCRLHKRVNV